MRSLFVVSIIIIKDTIQHVNTINNSIVTKQITNNQLRQQIIHKI